MNRSKGVSAYEEPIAQYFELVGHLQGGPQNLKVQNDTLYFTQGRKQELYSWKVPFEESGSKERRSSTKPIVAPSPVLTCSDTAEKKGVPLSKEEELLRERTRNIFTGISSYSIRKLDGAVFYISASNLFIYYPTGPRAGKEPLDVFSYVSPSTISFQKGKPCLHISHVQDTTGAGLLDVFFVQNYNLYNAKITEQLQNESQPLQVEVTPITTIGDAMHPCGIADYITQEEFDRYTGHYENEKYVIFSYIDVSMTPSLTLLMDENGVEQMPYPRVGDANCKVTIVVYDRRKKLFYYLPQNVIAKSVPFPVEYIPRFGFKDKDTIYLQVLDRPQERCVTLSHPIASLCEITEAELLQVYLGNGRKTKEFFPPLHVELEQHIPWAWIEILPEEPVVFGKHFDITIRSDVESKTAHYHLFVRPSGGSATSWKQLTVGAWNVRRGTVSISGNHVAFIANAGARLQRRLFYVTIPRNLYEGFSPFYESEIMPISREGECVLSYTITDKYALYSSSTSTEIPSLHFVEFSDHPESQEPRLVDIPTVPWIPNVVSNSVPPATPSNAASSVDGQQQTTVCGGLPVVLSTTVTVMNPRGVPISGLVFTPPSSAPSRATKEGRTEGGLPLVIYVYGGPHAQLVYENAFDKSIHPVLQCLLQEGFAVAIVDGQMSEANGLRALSVCKKNMGNFETSDYVTFVNSLTTFPERVGLPSSFKVDRDRVAIFGWSYGGYATLLAMSQASDLFKMGFSGAPIGDWRLYDTGYTERYLGLLHDSQSGESPTKAYTDSCIGNFANSFPDEVDRLYISHGLLDENVHFVHTSHIASALISAGKPYSLLIFPGERHGLRQNPKSKNYNYAMMMKILVEKL